MSWREPAQKSAANRKAFDRNPVVETALDKCQDCKEKLAVSRREDSPHGRRAKVISDRLSRHFGDRTEDECEWLLSGDIGKETPAELIQQGRLPILLQRMNNQVEAGKAWAILPAELAPQGAGTERVNSPSL